MCIFVVSIPITNCKPKKTKQLLGTLLVLLISAACSTRIK